MKGSTGSGVQQREAHTRRQYLLLAECECIARYKPRRFKMRAYSASYAVATDVAS